MDDVSVEEVRVSDYTGDELIVDVVEGMSLIAIWNPKSPCTALHYSEAEVMLLIEALEQAVKHVRRTEYV